MRRIVLVLVRLWHLSSLSSGLKMHAPGGSIPSLH
jgi:hypothetical protein